MPPEFEPALPTAERQAIAADWKRLSDAPPPPDRRSIGCMTAIIAVAIATAGPFLARIAGFDLAQSMRIGATVVLVIAFLAGLVMAFLGSGRFAHDSRRAQEALARLSGGGDNAPRVAVHPPARVRPATSAGYR